MMKLSLTGDICTGCSRFLLGLALLALLNIGAGRNFSGTP
jgi:hypothetical protein